jgi:hypothetical protein
LVTVISYDRLVSLKAEPRRSKRQSQNTIIQALASWSSPRSALAPQLMDAVLPPFQLPACISPLPLGDPEMARWLVLMPKFTCSPSFSLGCQSTLLYIVE